MKQFIIIGGGLAIAAFVTVLFLLYPPSGRPDQKHSVTPSTGNNSFVALLTPLANHVFARAPAPDAGHEVEIATSTRVQSGTRIKTSQTGRALVEGAHDAFLDSNAEIVVASLDTDQGSRIELETGKTWSRVKKVFDHGEFYEMETQNAVAVVRGTSFGLYYEEGTTTLIVTEGEVHLIARNPHTGVILHDTEVSVGPGKKAVRRGEEPIHVSAITEKDKGPWFKFNNPDDAAAPISSPVKKSQGATTVSPSSPTAIPSSPPTSGDAVLQEKLTLESVTPRDVEVSMTPDTQFELTGTGLDQTLMLQVGSYIVKDFRIIDSMHIIFFLHTRLSPDAYDVFVKNKTGTLAGLTNALRVYSKTSSEPPPASSPPPEGQYYRY